MATLGPFTIADDKLAELNQIAVKAGFANAKLMTVAYWKATIQAARAKAQRDALPEVTTDDVVIT